MNHAHPLITKIWQFFLYVLPNFKVKHEAVFWQHMPVINAPFRIQIGQRALYNINIYSEAILIKDIYLSMLAISNSQSLRDRPISSSRESIATSWI
jgi:hypothetical protein